MQQKNVTLINKLGLHARAAMKLVNCADRFQSSIVIHFNNREVNAKSIMNVMVIGATVGSELSITTEGDDEVEAMNSMIQLIENRFGESE